jgi:hypothetical protein
MQDRGGRSCKRVLVFRLDDDEWSLLAGMQDLHFDDRDVVAARGLAKSSIERRPGRVPESSCWSAKRS